MAWTPGNQHRKGSGTPPSRFEEDTECSCSRFEEDAQVCEQMHNETDDVSWNSHENYGINGNAPGVEVVNPERGRDIPTPPPPPRPRPRNDRIGERYAHAYVSPDFEAPTGRGAFCKTCGCAVIFRTPRPLGEWCGNCGNCACAFKIETVQAGPKRRGARCTHSITEKTIGYRQSRRRGEYTLDCACAVFFWALRSNGRFGACCTICACNTGITVRRDAVVGVPYSLGQHDECHCDCAKLDQTRSSAAGYYDGYPWGNPDHPRTSERVRHFANCGLSMVEAHAPPPTLSRGAACRSHGGCPVLYGNNSGARRYYDGYPWGIPRGPICDVPRHLSTCPLSMVEDPAPAAVAHTRHLAGCSLAMAEDFAPTAAHSVHSYRQYGPGLGGTSSALDSPGGTYFEV